MFRVFLSFIHFINIFVGQTSVKDYANVQFSSIGTYGKHFKIVSTAIKMHF